MSIDGIEEGHTGETPSCPQSAHLYRLHPLLFFLIIYTSCSLYLHAVTISSFGFLRLLRSSSSPTHSLDTHIALRSYSYGTFVVPNTSIVLDHICFLDINLKYTPQTIRTRPADSPYSSPPLLLSSLLLPSIALSSQGAVVTATGSTDEGHLHLPALSSPLTHQQHRSNSTSNAVSDSHFDTILFCSVLF